LPSALTAPFRLLIFKFKGQSQGLVSSASILTHTATVPFFFLLSS